MESPTLHLLLATFLLDSTTIVSPGYPAGVTVPNFISRNNPVFRNLCGTLEVGYQELHEEGVSTFVKHTPTVTTEEENDLWQSKVIGNHNSLAIL